ncbi:MAG: type VI secretion system tube protein Hcp [Gammaproteobacteria bacterium]|nr:type VI secretion system tube protein Hcp [Gammaproteobacteria bacterium]
MSIFMTLDGVQGESADKGHSKWIDVAYFQWGTKRLITSATSTRGDRESSNAVIRDLLIRRFMDRATPQLFIESCCGVGKTVTLHLTKTGVGGGADVYMKYVLKNALVSSYYVAGTREDTFRPVEHYKISFIELECRYTPYDENGKPMAPISVAFDTATSTKR